MERLKKIPDAIGALAGEHDIDVIVFQEVWFNDDPNFLEHFLSGPEVDYDQYYKNFATDLKRNGFPHIVRGQTRRASGRLAETGVVIASKWPIQESETIHFKSCYSGDCAAKKGALYARIEKAGSPDARVFHVFGTHLQSAHKKRAKKVRVEQVEELAAFIKRQVPQGRGDGVVAAGDLNIDLHTQKDHLKVVMNTIRAAQFPPAIAGEKNCDDKGRHLHCTMDRKNSLWGRDGSALFGPALFHGCQASYMRDKTCTCCPVEFLDYVVALNGFREVDQQSLHVIPMTVPRFPVCMRAPFEGYVPPEKCEHVWKIETLSDHYAVLGKITFKQGR